MIADTIIDLSPMAHAAYISLVHEATVVFEREGGQISRMQARSIQCQNREASRRRAPHITLNGVRDLGDPPHRKDTDKIYIYTQEQETFE